MKSKFKLSAGIVLLLVSSMTCALAQFGVAGGQPGFNPATGTPGAPQRFDPTTGAPLAPQPVPAVSAESEWRDDNWKDPKIVLTNVNFENLPISEIANFIRQEFKGEFDLLLPQSGFGAGSINQRTGFPMQGEQIDCSSIAINLRLKNVTASELFNAMNLLFENDATPLRWELKVNGTRQIALLRLLTSPTLNPPPPPAATVERRVYFVGNLIGDEKSGGMSMDQIVKTVTDVWQMTHQGGGDFQFHREAQLLIVTGAPDKIEFTEQTLKALREKVDLDRSQLSGRSQPKPAENKAKPEDSKTVPVAR